MKNVERVTKEEWKSLCELQKETLKIQQDNYKHLKDIARRVVTKYCNANAQKHDPDVMILIALLGKKKKR